jgi:hypothetical protein
MIRRSPRILVTTLCCLLALATSARAEQGYLDSVADWIPLWRSVSVIREGIDLDTAGQYDLAAQRMACLVDRGTRVIGVFVGRSGLPGGVSRIVVIEGEATGCTGYVETAMHFRTALERNRKPASPCWTTKLEMASVKAAIDAGNSTEARELSQKIKARMNECLGR